MASVYIKLGRNMVINSRVAKLKEVCEYYCDNPDINNKLGHITLGIINESSGNLVLSCVDITKKIKEEFPQLDITILGEPDILLEYEKPKESNLKTKIFEFCKVLIVALVTFMGTAFTIMAYHNDIGIVGVFDDIYKLFGQSYEANHGIMEISYSIGLAVGIVVFFNHIFGKKLVEDPTPIEVAMRNYEEDVDKAVIAADGRVKNTK